MRWVAAVLSLWIPFAAMGQTITVRSGEHETFSRLVFSLPTGTTWQFERTGQDYTLAFQPRPARIDLSRAFDLIPRDRVADITLTPDGVLFDLACRDCHAIAYRYETGWLVVDVIDGPAPEDLPVDGTGAEETASLLEPTVVPRNAGIMVVTPQRADSIAPVRRVPAPATEQLPLDINALPNRDARLPLVSDLDVALENSGRVTGMEQALLDGLARAASQGLLTPSVSFPATSESGRPEPLANDPDPPPTSQVEDAPGMPGIAARTSIERDRPHPHPDPETGRGEPCMDESLFAVPDWGDDRPFHEQLADRHGALTTETGVFVADELIALAKLYIHFGFGQEALSALGQADLPAPEAEVLEVMARVVDDLPQRSPLLAGQGDCSSDVALWSVLASSDRQNAAQADPDSVIQTLRRLPDALRGHLGQRLAEVFADFGDIATAEEFLKVARSGTTAEPLVEELVEVTIADRAGEPERAIRKLADLAGDEPRLSPEELIRLIEMSIAAEQAVPADILELSEVMRFENAAMPELVNRLTELEIRALLNNGDYVGTMARVEAADRLDAKLAVAFNSSSVAGLLNTASDDDILRLAFGDLPEIDAAAENALARRVLALGFPDRAMDLLVAEARQEDAADRRFLRADIALASGDFEDVERILAGMSEPEASARRIAALTALGQHEAALALAEMASNSDDTVLAWRADAWPRLETSADGPLREFAAARADREGGEGPDNDLPPLAGRRALLEQSADTRTLVLDLIEAFPVDPETPAPTQ